MPTASRPIPAASPSAWIASRSRCSILTAPSLPPGRAACGSSWDLKRPAKRPAVTSVLELTTAAIELSEPMNAVKPMIRCREIGDADIGAVADLLTRGFVGRSRDYWIHGLRRQAARAVPQGYPRFGYMLECDGRPAGVLLLLYSAGSAGTDIRCNLSSWYVEPQFRNYAPLLTRLAQRHKHVTYVNISPARWTWPTIEAQGFRPYCNGLFFSLPAF